MEPVPQYSITGEGEGAALVMLQLECTSCSTVSITNYTTTPSQRGGRCKNHKY